MLDIQSISVAFGGLACQRCTSYSVTEALPEYVREFFKTDVSKSAVSKTVHAHACAELEILKNIFFQGRENPWTRSLGVNFKK